MNRSTARAGPPRRPTTAGFSLVELLVVIAIVALLLALLLPALQTTRESARMTQCRSNVKQISSAFHSFLQQQGTFPASGWGFEWGAPHPDRGVGIEQPGGWAYRILPNIEQQPLFEMGTCGDPNSMTDSRLLAGNLARIRTPVPTFFCPSRRAPAAARNTSTIAFIKNVRMAGAVPAIALADYAANAGERVGDFGKGPATLAAGDAGTYGWPNPALVTGITHVRTRITADHVTDGLSNTYAAGEKYVNASAYDTAGDADLGDDQGPFASDDRDAIRHAADSANRYLEPRQDVGNVAFTFSWGSAHAATFTMAMCDGSVRSIAYGIDPTTHRRLANRRDGQTVSLGD